jgi:uncharacterized protein
MFDLRRLRLAVGDAHREEIQLGLGRFVLGGQPYEAVPGSVPGDLTVTRVSSGVLFELRFEATVFGPCQRCLEEARSDVAVATQEYQAHVPEPGSEQDTTTPYLEGDLLDVDRWALDSLLLAMPLKIVCRPDCAGLCPRCGTNLNDGSCDCPQAEPDDRWAKLRDLL